MGGVRPSGRRAQNAKASALARAATEADRLAAVGKLGDAIERGQPFEDAMPALLQVMATAEPAVRGTAVLTLERAAARGYDLTPAVPALVSALFETGRHHAARVLIAYVRQDQDRRAKPVARAIEAAGKKGRNPDLERVVEVCTSGVPAREWRWGRRGVHTSDGCVTWFNDATGRNSSTQTFAELRRRGAWAPSWIMKEHEVPDEVWTDLHRILGAKPRPRRSREAIEREVDQAVARLSASQTTASGAACAACKELQAGVAADHRADESLPASANRLRPALAFDQGDPSFHQCPACGRLYERERRTDNEVGASSDVETLRPIALDALRRRLLVAGLDLEWTWSFPRRRSAR